MREIMIGLFARNVVLLTIVIVAGYSLSDKYRFEWAPADYIATAAFVLLLSWLLLPRLDNRHFDDAPDGVALRLGKAAKRGLRRLKSLL